MYNYNKIFILLHYTFSLNIYRACRISTAAKFIACRIIAFTCKCLGWQMLFRTYSNKEPHGILQTLVQLTYHIQYLRQNLDMIFHHLSQRTFLNIIPNHMSSFSCFTICSVHGNGFSFLICRYVFFCQLFNSSIWFSFLIFLSFVFF